MIRCHGCGQLHEDDCDYSHCDCQLAIDENCFYVVPIHDHSVPSNQEMIDQRIKLSDTDHTVTFLPISNSEKKK